MKWYFIVAGCTPLLFAVYLTYKEEYFVAVGCFIIAFCGFYQVYEFLKLYEILEKQQIQLNKILKSHD